MTNINKINKKQKSIMAEYMQEHPDLARNILPNCAQGRTVAQRLWEQLSLKLNSAGPPIKELKMWRKVFADQKQNVKKKLSFNKASKQKTGGGPYQEKLLTASEELLLQATAMDVSVEGLSKVKAFGNTTQNQESEQNNEEMEEQWLMSEIDEPIQESQDADIVASASKPKKQKQEAATTESQKLKLLEANLKVLGDSSEVLHAKLDTLIELKQRSLAIKEEEHELIMQEKRIDLEIKTLRLEAIRSKMNE